MKGFNNPVFESLVFKANAYGMINEQTEKPTGGAVYKDFAVSLVMIGSKLVENYVLAVAAYPETDFKKVYIKELPAKIGSIAKSVNPQDNINAQIKSLLDAVTSELNVFLGESKKDGVYAKHLTKWRNSLRDAFSNYKLAIEDGIKYMSKYTGDFDPKVTQMLPDSLESIRKNVEEAAREREEFTANRESLDVSKYSKISESKTGVKEVIQKLVDKKIAIDFSTFSAMINEEKLSKREAKKEFKSLIAQIDSTIGAIGGILSQLAVREADPRRKDFKSLQMKPTFSQLAADINDIRSQITDDTGELKKRSELVDLPLDQLSTEFDKFQTLFQEKKKEYEDLYTQEEGGLKSIKTLDVATPEINRRIGEGDQIFATLPTLALSAGQAAADEIQSTKSKPATNTSTGTTTPTGDFKIKNPIKKGSKEKENVKKFQELVVDKMKDLKGKSDEYDQLAAAKSQFGNFGSKTASIVSFLKAGFGINDGNTDITQELIDKIQSHDGKIKESYSLFEEFDLGAAKKASSKSVIAPAKKKESKKTSEDGGSPKNIFACIKNLESGLEIKGKQASFKRDNGNIHTFNADGTYKFYHASKKKTQEGTWKCTADGYEAYTEEDKDTYFGKIQDWKSNLDAAEKAKVEKEKKAAAELSAKAGEICKKILVEMTGDTENEEKVADIFKDEVTTPEMFNAVENFWNNKWWPAEGQLRWKPDYYRKKSVDEITKLMDFKSGKNGYSLRGLIKHFFSNSQLALLNGYLPNGVRKI